MLDEDVANVILSVRSQLNQIAVDREIPCQEIYFRFLANFNGAVAHILGQVRNERAWKQRQRGVGA